MEPILFELESVLGVDGQGGFVATFTLVDEDDDEVPPLVAEVETCTNCGAMARDLKRHRCYW